MPEVRTFGAGAGRPRTLLVGCGGAGCNTLRVVSPMPGVDVVAMNDGPHPSLLGIKRRVFLPTRGLKELASMDGRAVKTLASTAEQAIALELRDADLVVPIAGLGGEMGGWGATLVARVATLKGAATLAVATTPFSAEGSGRRAAAAQALDVLRAQAHGTLLLPNDRLLKIAPHLPLLRALEAMSRLAVQPVYDLLRVLTRGDLPLLKSVLRNAAEWELGIGEGLKDHPELAAVDAAFRSPWITTPPEEARQAIVLINAPQPDDRAVREILHDVDLRAPRASVLWGAYAGPEVDALRVTLLLGR
ncbi:MAG: hypothetical protein HY557_05360 [Euryarchaeota archaeon]|nr:hypothetical protein [Euryarchaeota archaeon]